DVAGHVDERREGEGYVEADVILRIRPGSGSDLVAVDRTALPRVHRTEPSMEGRIVVRGAQVSTAVIQEGARRLRLQEEQRRHAERLDVPHHMAVVVVVVRPVRESEQ